MASFLRKISIFLLRVYHETVSPLLPNACRFYPSCSIYVSDAVRKYGMFKGGWIGLCRLARCRPANPGGYDPVN